MACPATVGDALSPNYCTGVTDTSVPKTLAVFANPTNNCDVTCATRSRLLARPVREVDRQVQAAPRAVV